MLPTFFHFKLKNLAHAISFLKPVWTQQFCPIGLMGNKLYRVTFCACIQQIYSRILCSHRAHDTMKNIII